MGRLRKENPRYTVISLRISEEEHQHLKELLVKTSKSVSHFMRDALRHFAAHHEQGEQDHQVA